MIKKFLFAFLLLLSSAYGFSQDQLMQAAYEKLSKRNFEGAVQDFNLILINKPDDIEAICGRAEASINLGKYIEALKDAEQAISYDVNNGRAYSIKGDALFYQKDYQNALKTYEIAIQKKGAPAQATVGKSKVLNQLGNSKEAFKILEEAIGKQPSNAEFYYARGLLNNTKEKYSKALQDFDKVILLNPRFNPFGVFFNRGISNINLSEIENAVKDFSMAIEIDPTNATAYHSRGLALYQLDDYKSAIEDFLKSADISPNNPVTFYNLGMAYNKFGDKENACLYFHKSCQLGNTNSCKMIILVCSDAKQNR